MKNQLSALLLIVALPAMADSLPLPKDTPASYRSECGSCHLPFHPALLAASDWQQTLNQLDKHFGSDAAVDRKTRQEISQFLERYAGDPARPGPGRQSAASHQDQPLYPQAPGNSGQNLERSAHQVSRELRSLSPQCRQRSIQRT